jgi:nucleoside-diphosphate-sugar epimerase
VTTVAVTGANGPLGERVCARVLADPDVVKLVRTDAIPGAGLNDAEAVGELKALLDGVDTIVHLGASLGPELDGTGAADVDVEGTRRLLDVAGTLGVDRLVVLSSAMVYGAWSNNPVPLTEDDPLRPNPSLAFAVRKAEVERLTAEWHGEHPDATVAILRPTIALAEESAAWMGRSLWATGAVQSDDLEPPAQFVHLDDLAAAVDLARVGRLDGVYNVAPDGWIPPEQRRALAGPRARLRLPERVASKVASWRWRLGLTPTPPDILPYTVHPWVVANDRLREAGWEPANSNEETFVAGHPAGPFADLNSRRRQELALGAVGGVAAALVLAVVALVVRARRRRTR